MFFVQGIFEYCIVKAFARVTLFELVEPGNEASYRWKLSAANCHFLSLKRNYVIT